MKVMPSFFCKNFNSLLILILKKGSKADKGSSKSKIDGLVIRALAKATLCCWPPDNWAGNRSENSDI